MQTAIFDHGVRYPRCRLHTLTTLRAWLLGASGRQSILFFCLSRRPAPIDLCRRFALRLLSLPQGGKAKEIVGAQTAIG